MAMEADQDSTLNFNVYLLDTLRVRADGSIVLVTCGQRAGQPFRHRKKITPADADFNFWTWISRGRWRRPISQYEIQELRLQFKDRSRRKKPPNLP